MSSCTTWGSGVDPAVLSSILKCMLCTSSITTAIWAAVVGICTIRLAASASEWKPLRSRSRLLSLSARTLSPFPLLSRDDGLRALGCSCKVIEHQLHLGYSHLIDRHHHNRRRHYAYVLAWPDGRLSGSSCQCYRRFQRGAVHLVLQLVLSVFLHAEDGRLDPGDMMLASLYLAGRFAMRFLKAAALPIAIILCLEWMRFFSMLTAPISHNASWSFAFRAERFHSVPQALLTIVRLCDLRCWRRVWRQLFSLNICLK